MARLQLELFQEPKNGTAIVLSVSLRLVQDIRNHCFGGDSEGLLLANIIPVYIEGKEVVSAHTEVFQSQGKAISRSVPVKALRSAPERVDYRLQDLEAKLHRRIRAHA